MISRISGRLEGVEGNAAEVAVPDTGLSYEVLVPGYLAAALANRVGEPLTLHTRQHLESVSQGNAFIPRMIGFESARDRRFFEVFTSVKGLGVRKALRALAADPGRIAGWIAARDAKSLQTLPEIGKRLAETIVAELHGKIEPFALEAGERSGLDAGASGEPKPAGELTAPMEQAIRALVTLGEAPADARRLVVDVTRREPDLGTPDEILAAVYAGRA